MSVGVTRRKTLASVRNAIRERNDLPDHAKRDMVSALQTVAKVSGKPLDTLSADVGDLRGVLDGLLPASRGISAARWRNIRSLVAKGLDVSGVTTRPERGRLPDEWESLLDQLPDKARRISLVPFARYCALRGLAPSAVGQETFSAYARHLNQHRLLSNPRAVERAAARSWNWALRHVPGWPPVRAVIDSQRDWYTVSWRDLPRSLKAEVDAWIAKSLDPDPLDIDAPKPLRPVSARGRERAIRAFASALILSGHGPERLRSLADMIEPRAARTGLRWFMNRTGEDRSAYLKGFALLLLAIARHVVYAANPDAGKEHIAELQRLCKAVDPGRKGMTRKNRDLLRRFDDDHTFASLMALPERIWRRHDGKSQIKTSELIELQVALAVQLLIHAPIRLRNLVSIRLGENLRDVGARRHRRLYVYFPPSEVKNEFELEFELSGMTMTLLDRYLKEVRPQLICDPSPYLFPSRRGGHKIPYILSNQIADLTATELGVRITAHQFRHIAGHVYLTSVPGGHEVVRRLLGHKSIHTTIEFYAGMETRAAHRHYDNLISRKRFEERPPATNR